MKILLVEDEQETIDFVKVAINNCYLVICHTVEAALRELVNCENEKKFDCILLDLGLPDSQGMDTFYAVHGEAVTIPLIIITGVKNQLLSRKLIELGASNFVIKESSEWSRLQEIVCEATGKCVVPKTKLRQVLNLMRELNNSELSF
jgi:hypothetical protein